jgi:DNA-binding beta-propeller fold protein YncE
LALGEARADFTNLLATNISGNTVSQFNRVTGASLGLFASGVTNPQEITINPANNNVYVSTLGSTVQAFNGTTGASLGAFVTAGLGGLSNARGLQFEGTGLFVASFATNSVIQYNGTTGALVGTFVPAGSGGLSAPTGLAFSPVNGDLFVSSSGASSNSILEYNGTTGAFVKAFATGLNAPADITFAPNGGLFVSNFGANNVLWFNSAGTLVGTLTAAGLTSPSGIAYDVLQNKLFVASGNTNAIYSFNINLAGGTFTSNGVFATDNGLNVPIGLALSPIPEPSSVVLFGLGTVAVVGYAARKARRGLA